MSWIQCVNVVCDFDIDHNVWGSSRYLWTRFEVFRLAYLSRSMGNERFLSVDLLVWRPAHQHRWRMKGQWGEIIEIYLMRGRQIRHWVRRRFSSCDNACREVRSFSDSQNHRERFRSGLPMHKRNIYDENKKSIPLSRISCFLACRSLSLSLSLLFPSFVGFGPSWLDELTTTLAGAWQRVWRDGWVILHGSTLEWWWWSDSIVWLFLRGAKSWTFEIGSWWFLHKEKKTKAIVGVDHSDPFHSCVFP